MLDDLIARVEAAEAGSRELDCMISVELRVLSPHMDVAPWAVNWTGPYATKGGRVYLVHSDGSLGPNWTPPPLTTSLDAALGLVERKLPGICWGVEIGLGGFDAYVSRNRVGTGHWLSEAFGKTPALALILALLRALASKDTSPRSEGEEPPALGKFCDACQAIPTFGYCKLAGCPLAPAEEKRP